MDESARFAGLRLLLVEDNELNQTIASGLLEAGGVAVDVAPDGAVALDMLDASANGFYAAVLMDMQMPVMDGLAATRALRRNPRFAKLPVIAMTANAMQHDRDACLAAGMNDHVAKPIEEAVLWATLGRHVGAPAPRPSPLADKGAADDADVLPELGGVDMAAGLRRCLGNRQRYRLLLQQFAQTQRGVPDAVVAALGQGDAAGAERAAHTLRGLAATIGAPQLEQHAQAVETLIRQGQSQAVLQLPLAALRVTLGELVAQIDAAMAPSAAAPLDPSRVASLQAACRRLMALLRAGDTDAVLAFERFAALAGPAAPRRMQALAAAVQAPDHATAVRLLGELAGELFPD
ncbi:response regulator [Ramlibacter sp. 2FC]|uniref:response regulator n=1 Tax=Ramlibacter sp. 2FC TaxID=2502188 RepID=UPI0010F66D8C|nr:response regulator [Ramlibacter sp. 2FC]